MIAIDWRRIWWWVPRVVGWPASIVALLITSLFTSGPYALHHRFPMGSRQVSNEAIIKKPLRNHFQSRSCFSQNRSHFLLSQATNHIETELKLRSQSYNTVRQNLESLEKKQRSVSSPVRPSTLTNCFFQRYSAHAQLNRRAEKGTLHPGKRILENLARLRT